MLPTTEEKATLQNFDPEIHSIYTTLDPIDAFNAMQEAISMDETKGNPILVTDILVHSVELRAATGELQKQARTILKTKEGKLYSQCSDGVLQSLKMISSLLGNAPWPNGIKVALKTAKTTAGRNVHKLIIIK